MCVNTYISFYWLHLEKQHLAVSERSIPGSIYGSDLKVKQPYIVIMHIPPKACLNFKSLDRAILYKRWEILRTRVKKTSTHVLHRLNILFTAA